VSDYFAKVFLDAKVFAQQSFSEATDNNKYYAPQFTERLNQHCTPEIRGGSSRQAAAVPEKCKAKDSAKRPISPEVWI